MQDIEKSVRVPGDYFDAARGKDVDRLIDHMPSMVIDILLDISAHVFSQSELHRSRCRSERNRQLPDLLTAIRQDEEVIRNVQLVKRDIGVLMRKLLNGPDIKHVLDPHTPQNHLDGQVRWDEPLGVLNVAELHIFALDTVEVWQDALHEFNLVVGIPQDLDVDKGAGDGDSSEVGVEREMLGYTVQRGVDKGKGLDSRGIGGIAVLAISRTHKCNDHFREACSPEL
jgi:hypothetical protein